MINAEQATLTLPPIVADLGDSPSLKSHHPQAPPCVGGTRRHFAAR